MALYGARWMYSSRGTSGASWRYIPCLLRPRRQVPSFRYRRVSRVLRQRRDTPDNEKWSGRWESNPRLKLGKLGYYHYTTPAQA
jgi:hypothetical protein